MSSTRRRSNIQSLVSLTGFSLVGGPAYNDASAAEVALSELDVPYIAAHPLEFQSIEQWGDSTRGLLPVESTIMVAIPELDGSILPMVYGGRPGPAGKPAPVATSTAPSPSGPRSQDMFTCSERTDMLSCTGGAFACALRRQPRAERKLAIVLFNFPPNAGSVGTAAHLSVFQSLLQHPAAACRSRATSVDLPATRGRPARALAARQRQPVRHPSQCAACHRHRATMSATNAGLSEIEAQWGPAPGKHLTNGQSAVRAWARTLVKWWSPCNLALATKAIQCACCLNRLRAHPCLQRVLPLPARRLRRCMRCCTLAPTARSNSCPASKPACRPNAGLTA
jgi:magnesium chelatase subunit H